MTNEEAIKHVENMKKGVFLFHPNELYDTIINALKDRPTGHWKDIVNNRVECSECGHKECSERFMFEDINYCTRCGAKME